MVWQRLRNSGLSSSGLSPSRLGRSGLWRWPDLFLQSDCWLCDRATPQSLCPSCERQLAECVLPTDRQLQPAVPSLPPPLSLPQLHVLAWARYQNSVRRLLTQLKYENRPAVGDFLGQKLAQTCLWHALPPLTLVPIPLHADRQAQRGYNQAELIARSIGRFTGRPLLTDWLIRVQSTTAQYGLSLADRQQNLQNAFQLNSRRSGQRPGPVLLIDDIYTTGATVQAARQTLEQAGVRVWGVAVVAR
jgi:ComF family protein